MLDAGCWMLDGRWQMADGRPRLAAAEIWPTLLMVRTLSRDCARFRASARVRCSSGPSAVAGRRSILRAPALHSHVRHPRCDRAEILLAVTNAVDHPIPAPVRHCKRSAVGEDPSRYLVG